MHTYMYICIYIYTYIYIYIYIYIYTHTSVDQGSVDQIMSRPCNCEVNLVTGQVWWRVKLGDRPGPWSGQVVMSGAGARGQVRWSGQTGGQGYFRGQFRHHFEPFSFMARPSGASRGPILTILGPSWGLLIPTWGHLGQAEANLEPT